MNIKHINQLNITQDVIYKPINTNLEFEPSKPTFKVIETSPTGYEFVSPTKNIIIKILQQQKANSYVIYHKIGGLKQQLNRIKKLIELPINNQSLS